LWATIARGTADSGRTPTIARHPVPGELVFGQADRGDRGVVKLVAEAGTGRVRGVHAVADGAGEMITAAGYAIRTQMTVADVAEAWAPYLTMSESLRFAAQAFTRDVSRLSCCAA
jgi:mercuric reductase